MKFHVEPLLRVGLFGRILVEHDDDLRHIVELAHQGDVLHGPSPLFILTLDQTSMCQHCQQRVNVGLGSEI